MERHLLVTTACLGRYNLMEKYLQEIYEYCEEKGEVKHVMAVLQNLIDGATTTRQVVRNMRELVTHYLESLK